MSLKVELYCLSFLSNNIFSQIINKIFKCFVIKLKFDLI